MNTSRKAILALVLALISIALITVNIMRTVYENPKPESHQITDKCEVDGKCYIETWIEVTPEEYIGLDIGDPYPIE